MANIKPINEVPVVEEVAEGDKVLVNRSGAAVQIPANALGGGGGGSAAGGVVYADLQSAMMDESGEVLLQAYTDPEMTTLMDYETGKNILLGAGKFSQSIDAFAPGAVVYVTASMVMTLDEAKVMQVLLMVAPDSGTAAMVTFSDSIGL